MILQELSIFINVNEAGQVCVRACMCEREDIRKVWRDLLLHVTWLNMHRYGYVSHVQMHTRYFAANKGQLMSKTNDG